MPQEQSVTKERQRIRNKEPRRFKVIIYNDDFTTMNFVVLLLMEVFFYNEEDANALMLKVHHHDKAVVGVYSYDVAVSKMQKGTKMAVDNGYPLRLSVEPEE